MGSTTRSLVIALRTDATGMSPGFQQAQQETIRFTQATAQAQEELKRIRGLPAQSDAEKQVKAQMLADQQDQIKFQRFLRDESAASAKLEYDQERQRAVLLDARVQRELTAQETIRNGAIRNQEEIAQKIMTLNRRFERSADLAAAGMRPSFGQGWNPSEESGGFGGGGFGQGWMMRMGAMDIARQGGDIMAPGLGNLLAMPAYFGAGGGAALIGIGVAAAALGVAAAGVNDYRQAIKATEEAQASLNAELAKSALQFDMLAEKTVKFDQVGEAARSSYEQSQSTAIGGYEAVDKAQIDYQSTYFFGGKELAALDAARQSAEISKRRASFARESLYGGATSPDFDRVAYWASTLGLSITDIEAQRAGEDVQRAQTNQQILTASAQESAGLADMQPGRAKERAEAAIQYNAKMRDIGMQRNNDLVAIAREREDKLRSVRESFFQQHIGDLNYDIDNDPQYAAQVAATNKAVDLESQRTAAERDGASARAQIEFDAANARIKLDTENFDRKQGYELNLSKIAGEFDPYERQLHNQMELNRQKEQQLALDKGITDEEKKRQAAIDQQLITNIEVAHWREVDNRLKGLADAAAVARLQMTPLEAERQQYLREHPGLAGQIEADRLKASEKEVENAQLELSIREKEIGIAERRGLINPGMADYLKLKIEHPDVDDKLLRMMAMLDRVGSGQLSTGYTAGQTNFGALYGNLGGGSGGGASPFGQGWGSAFGGEGGAFGRGYGGFFGLGASPYAASNPMISSSNPMISSSNPLIKSSAQMMAMTGTQSDNPQQQGNQIMRDIRTILKQLATQMN